MRGAIARVYFGRKDSLYDLPSPAPERATLVGDLPKALLLA